MKSSVRHIIMLALVAAASLMGRLSAQQITKFAVVDTSRVYQAYFMNSAPVRNYENKKKEFQDEINTRTQELQALHDKKLEYEKSGDAEQAARVQTQITQKTNYLTEYTKAKNVELSSLKKSLEDNDEFYKKLYATLENIAESGGYSMILSLQDGTSILWYSSSVDITDAVISRLGLN